MDRSSSTGLRCETRACRAIMAAAEIFYQKNQESAKPPPDKKFPPSFYHVFVVILAEHLDERQIHPVRVSAGFGLCHPASLPGLQTSPPILAGLDHRVSGALPGDLYRSSNLAPAIVDLYQHQRAAVL